MDKSILVFGGSGFVGSAICKYALSKGIKVLAVSRSGKPKRPEPWQNSVEYIKGDAMDQSTYSSLIPSVSAVVHSIGVLLDSKGPFNLKNIYEGSYEHMNRDTALRILEILENKNKPFVYISAERGMFFSPGYLNTKREVETFLHLKQDCISSTIIRPGFMYSKNNNMLKTISCGINLLNSPDKFISSFGAKYFSQTFIPARSLDVDVVAKVAVLGCFEKEIVGKTLDVDDIDRVAKEFKD
ncbi:hypothetical protein SteCoe_13280 [Stentor coeruleus]|uniref:NAD-dependent epimerase/dehydratase domain-containing protein n=1 Tax=Stentor coeruleus TaxID=5963 RepID=A0A1R2C8U6_9CILI|nr:hypothetical protein SteCoe_13280 [Stentor coeruleus]